MHILMTDVLTCPRCGPRFGLILIADRMTPDRRIVEGALGCSNCREKYPVRNGIVDFTGTIATDEAGAADGADTAAAGDDGEAAIRVAALLGLTGGPGYVLLAGSAAGRARTVSSLLDDIEVVTATTAGAATAIDAAPPANISRLAVGGALPLASARMAGVFLAGGAADTLLEEAARTVAPLGRLVLEPAPADAGERLRAAGMRVLLQEGETVIAVNRHAAGGN
jgi:uncharacterized protein YbaR (Trm112 family)